MYILPCNFENDLEQVELCSPDFEIDALAFHIVKLYRQSSWRSHFNHAHPWQDEHCIQPGPPFNFSQISAVKTMPSDFSKRGLTYTREDDFPRGDFLLECVFSSMSNTLLYFKIRKLPCPSIFIKRFYNLCFNGWVIKTVFRSIPQCPVFIPMIPESYMYDA